MKNAECRMPSCAPRTPHSALRTPHSERAVALVITLVLLSVITFMAFTFLIVSRSEHGSVATETDNATARLAAEAARERAIVQLLAPILTWTNEFNYGLLVSTNYINPAGFDPAAPGPVNPTNVNYDHIVGSGAALAPNQWLQNVANLLYDPRPPVFITNRLFANSNDFRFYLDLNRNGVPDPNGLLPVIGPQGVFYDLFGNPMTQMVPGNTLSNYFVGDPEWIGVLQRPEFAHSANNRFIARYAYLVVPASQTLDVNTIHDFAKRTLVPSRPDIAWPDGFLRNQGVLTAEINLAAFLSDLNTNLWPNINQLSSQYGFASYIYNTNLAAPSVGAAADDAASFVRYRYATNLNSLASVRKLFNIPQDYPFTNIDAYSEGPLMVGTWWPPFGYSSANLPPRLSAPWAGCDNPNRFYDTQDLFDKSKFSVGGSGRLTPFSFADRLKMAGTNVDSYNRTTFYRLLSQLGTDSAPEPGGKMNLNYRNVDDYGYVVPNMATNFIPWHPTNFFMNAAIRLLADAGYAAGPYNSTSNILLRNSNWVNGVWLAVTNLNIPIWPTNYYTPSVHRAMQLAANIYDSTTNRTDLTGYPYLPTVFRPIFAQGGGRGGSINQVSIIGYREVTPADTANLVGRWDTVRDLSDPNDFKNFKPGTDMVYNIPLVIGAKKGFPSFNEFAMHTQVQVTRKLQFHRPGDSTTLPVNEINQMFVLGISNVLGVEAWNSYANSYPREVDMYVWPDISVLVTNLETRRWLNSPPLLSRYRQTVAVTTNILANNWFGYDSAQEWTSFQIPLATNLVFLTNAVYRTAMDAFVVPLTGQFERNPGATNFHLPIWQVRLRPRLRFAMVDRATSRIVDYVNLADDVSTNLTQALAMDGSCGEPYTPNGSNGSMWCTNRMYGIYADHVATYGIQNQLEASLGHVTADWNSSTHEFPAGMSQRDAINFFRGQFIPGYAWSSNSFNAPFQPFRNVYFLSSWQANDPLVHYNTGDLSDVGRATMALDNFSSGAPDPVENLRKVNRRYAPWGRTSSSSATAALDKYTLDTKDPVNTVERPEGRSDDWDFPANKFPNAGWLGRVHRGTPWQTVYFKSPGVDLGKWRQWTGNPVVMTNYGQIAPSPKTPIPYYYAYADAYLTQPTNDWHLLDLFTTALNDNATRGQLSINQTNLAAWSAVLSGVITLTNSFDANGNAILAPQVVQPAGLYSPFDTNTWPPLVQLVKRINDYRATNNTRHVFSRLGDLLAVPELTVASPFLNTALISGFPNPALNDAAYERLPQQIAGLLKVDTVPRFVIYAFGQTLKPAQRAPFVTSGQFAGLCTNYQIVAEAAIRTVVRLEGAPPYQGTNTVISSLHPVVESFNVLPPD